MKSRIIIILLAILVSSCFTEKTEKSTRYRIIKNLTNYKVEFIITTEVQASYLLSKGDSLVFEGYCETGFGELCFVPWEENIPISGKLVFDKEKEIYFLDSGCEDGRNPLSEIRSSHFCGYEVRTNEGRREYIYYINDSDYERAVPIED